MTVFVVVVVVAAVGFLTSQVVVVNRGPGVFEVLEASVDSALVVDQEDRVLHSLYS